MITQVQKPVLEVHDLTVSYGRNPVLWNIDFTLPKGSLAGIIGPNGAGKSSLIKAIMGLLEINNGYIKVFDQGLNEVRKKISYVPQRESVDWDFPASALDIVQMGTYHKLGLFRRPGKAEKALALDCLKKVGMEKYRDRQISELSGGQQQRVFIARALAQQAEIYFMDEPFAGVDISTENMIVDLLKDMTAEGKTVIVVHHDIHSAPKYFDWIIMLNMYLVASGPTEKVLTEALLEKTFGGKLSLLSDAAQLIKEKGFNPLKS
ncbi:metal ABC transporter ATP-binding protein [Litoribacter populi]|uniref:metal ABC transporter ATP-binding protein n=1 Tax=Litoribacter populi TaxID=2598460 RepID=UPI00117F5760|nr:metal ABC transporter ATP-binding protein [Litoribacter populi]